MKIYLTLFSFAPLEETFSSPYSQRKLMPVKTHNGDRDEKIMSAKELGKLTPAIKEVTQSHVDTFNEAKQSMKETQKSAGSVNKLSKKGNKNYLIKAGMALVIFPEPIVSDLLGTSLIAAGLVQEGIRRNQIYLEDMPKAFKSAMKDLKNTRELF